MVKSIISIVGSLNYDLVTFTDAVPQGGETYKANTFESHLGGKGLNEAIATARLTGENADIKIRMIGNVGDDSFGKELNSALKEAGVDSSYVKVVANKSSGVAVIIVEQDSGENRILITPGANGELKPSKEDYERYFSDRDTPHFVMLQNEYPDTLETIEWLNKNRPDVKITYNPSPFKKELITGEILKKLDLLIVNEGEALSVASSLLGEEELKGFENVIKQDLISGCSDLSRKLQLLLRPSNLQTVVITLGSKGSIFASSQSGPTFVPASKVSNVVDTTGAGDTFFGALVLQLAGGSKLEEAVKFATKASGLVIQKKGAAESIPKKKDVDSLSDK